MRSLILSQCRERKTTYKQLGLEIVGTTAIIIALELQLNQFLLGWRVCFLQCRPQHHGPNPKRTP